MDSEGCLCLATATPKNATCVIPTSSFKRWIWIKHAPEEGGRSPQMIMPASGVEEHRTNDMALRSESIEGHRLGFGKRRAPMGMFSKIGVGEEPLAEGHRVGVAGRERGLRGFQREAFVEEVCFVELAFREGA